MKWIMTFISMLSLTLINISCNDKELMERPGCMDKTASNYDDSANIDCNNCCTYYPKKKGTLLFWTGDHFNFFRCGPITIKLSNYQESVITGSYGTSARDCINRYGGYFYVDEGIYNYELIPRNRSCNLPGGTVRVTGDGCALQEIQR